MKKTALIVIGIGAAWFLGYLVHRALLSEEARIRELMDDMAEGFNAGSPSAAMQGLDASFHEETSGATRAEIHQFLVWLYFNERDPKTKDFRFRVELEDIEVLLGPEKQKADLKLRAVFLELRAKEFKPVCEIDLEADLEKKDSGWRVLASRHTLVSGKRPF